MTDGEVISIITGALEVAGKVAAPMLVVTLVIGVVVSLLQTVTQIQEQSLTFVPKLVGVAAIIVLGGHWIIHELTSWVTGLWSSIPTLI